MNPPETPSASPQEAPAKQPGLPEIDVNEYGGKKDGVRQSMNRRLFMQLIVFELGFDHNSERTAAVLAEGLVRGKIPGVVYADTMHPRRLGLLTWSEDPSLFVHKIRPLFAPRSIDHIKIRPEFGMIGRTYSTGHEPDLGFVLLERPVKNVLDERFPWHIWYPLRRNGAFAQLSPQDQGGILREHASIGMAYGQQELAHDIRLACHGLDARDNEFVIGLVGPELAPLSHLVQTMRKTKQTSEYISQMGPFFVGYVLHRST